jgi:hypothetical protein
VIRKVLPGDETVLLIPATEVNGVPFAIGATGLVNYEDPTVALLNRYIPIVSPASANAGQGGNISCAIRNDMTLKLDDSATDGDKSLCSKGTFEELTFYNFSAELNGFDDIDPTDTTSEFNLFKDLTRAPDVPYLIAHRQGYDNDTLAAVGQKWDFYYAWTGNPLPVIGDGNNLLTKAKFIPKNIVNFGYRLAA